MDKEIVDEMLHGEPDGVMTRKQMEHYLRVQFVADFLRCSIFDVMDMEQEKFNMWLVHAVAFEKSVWASQRDQGNGSKPDPLDNDGIVV